MIGASFSVSSFDPQAAAYGYARPPPVRISLRLNPVGSSYRWLGRGISNQPDLFLHEQGGYLYADISDDALLLVQQQLGLRCVFARTGAISEHTVQPDRTPAFAHLVLTWA
jgi:hypothetical protein